MRAFGFYWGITGVIGILLLAVARLWSKVVEMSAFELSSWHWLALVIFSGYMAYAEGYKGFHLNFAPRVVARAGFFQSEFFTRKRGGRQLLFTLLAPLVCMGFLYATPKRRLVSIAVTSAIVTLVLLVRLVPQPWRGIIDSGVVLGLCIGITSIFWFWIQAEKGVWPRSVPPDFPER